MERSLNDLDLSMLYRSVRYRRRMVFFISITGAALGLAIALLLPNIYRAQALLAPVSGIEGSGSSLSGKLSGFASLAGVSLADGEDRKVEALATLNSRALLDAFVQDENLLPILFADDWDAASKTWRMKDPKDAPTEWDAYKLMEKKIRRVTEDKQTGLVTLSIDWTDARLAASWASRLIVRTNTLLKQRAIERSQRNIRYLSEQLEMTSVLEIRQAIYKLIENEIRTIMIAQSSDEYAFKVIDPAVVPKEKNSPKRAAIVASSIIVGFFFGCLIAAFLGAPSNLDRRSTAA